MGTGGEVKVCGGRGKRTPGVGVLICRSSGAQKRCLYYIAIDMSLLQSLTVAKIIVNINPSGHYIYRRCANEKTMSSGVVV